MRFEQALTLLDQARVQQGSSRAEILEILELQGVSRATVGRRDDAEASFDELLTLDPDAKLPKHWGPKIQTIFFAAKSWMDSHAPLTLAHLPPKLDQGLVSAVSVQVGPDDLHLAAHLAVHFESGSSVPDAVVAVQPSAAMQVALPAPAAEVKWSARLLGPHDEVLVELGAAPNLIDDHGSAPAEAPVALAAPPPPVTAAPVTSPPAATAVAATPPSSEPSYPLRPLAYGLAGVGAVGVIVGVIFGTQVSSENAQLNSPTLNGQGQITSLTQTKAAALSKQAQQNAFLADVFLISGGALIAGGGGLWIWGALNPEPGGGGEVGIAARW